MKKLFVPLLAGFTALTLLPGCLVLDLEGRKSSTTTNDHHPSIGQQVTAPTLGQQLIDLQKAKDCGAITDAEYQAQKTALLGIK